VVGSSLEISLSKVGIKAAYWPLLPNPAWSRSLVHWAQPF